jgi:hypothetical protein
MLNFFLIGEGGVHINTFVPSAGFPRFGKTAIQGQVAAGRAEARLCLIA